jgi:hypothetical protein
MINNITKEWQNLDEIVNEVVISDNSNNIEFPLQIEAELEEISDLDEILNLDQLEQKN